MKIVTKKTGDSLTATEFNQLPNEIQNAITSAGLSPTASSTTQLAQTISRFVGDASFYSTSGSANNIILSSISPRPTISTLTSGMQIRFQALFNNTSSVTVNVNGAGAKNVTLDGNLLTSGKIVKGKVYLLTYIASTDSFDLFTAGYNTNYGQLAFFDLVTKDHILSYEETNGLALLGTYVYRDANEESEIYGYQDFYNTCLTEKNEATSQSVSIAGTTVYIYKHSNGHIYYDIADKAAFDTLYANTGVAWYYGIDETNHRIFLPRNDFYFKNGTTANVGNGVGAGLPKHTHTRGTMNITGTTYAENRGSLSRNPLSGAFYIGSETNYSGSHSTDTDNARAHFDASRSWTGNTSNPVYDSGVNISDSNTVQPPSVSALVYMVVGSTEETQLAQITEYLDVLQLFLGIDAGHPSDTRVNYYDAGNVSDNYDFLEYIDGGSPSDVYISQEDILNLLNYPTYKATVATMQGTINTLENEITSLTDRIASLEELIDAGNVSDR